jgi:hypothetical protein
MFGINWSDPETYWLNITNAALGIVVLLCVAAVAFGVLQELYARRRLRTSGLDREVKDLVTSFDGHAFDVPGLGLTMADGGEPIDPKKDNEKH